MPYFFATHTSHTKRKLITMKTKTKNKKNVLHIYTRNGHTFCLPHLEVIIIIIPYLNRKINACSKKYIVDIQINKLTF